MKFNWIFSWNSLWLCFLSFFSSQKEKNFRRFSFQKSFLFLLFLFRQIHPIGNFGEILKFLEKSQKKRKSKEKQKNLKKMCFLKHFFQKMCYSKNIFKYLSFSFKINNILWDWHFWNVFFEIVFFENSFCLFSCRTMDKRFLFSLMLFISFLRNVWFSKCPFMKCYTVDNNRYSGYCINNWRTCF